MSTKFIHLLLNSFFYQQSFVFFSSFTAVRYGRVPKRTPRDIVSSNGDEIVVNNNQSIVLTNTNARVVNSVTSSTTLATNSYLSNGGDSTLLVSSQMCSLSSATNPPIEQYASSADMIEASQLNNNNNNNNNNLDDQSVYNVIHLLSQAIPLLNRTENATKGLNHRPLTMPNNHTSTASIINTNNLISSTSTTATQNSSMDDNGVSWRNSVWFLAADACAEINERTGWGGKSKMKK